MTESRHNERSLVIRDVKPSDAGQFTVREEFTGQAADVDLTVIGKLSPLILVQPTVLLVIGYSCSLTPYFLSFFYNCLLYFVSISIYLV